MGVIKIMNYDEKQQKTLIEDAKKNNTYICGADGKLCGYSKDKYFDKFPCHKCPRNIHWKLKNN